MGPKSDIGYFLMYFNDANSKNPPTRGGGGGGHFTKGFLWNDMAPWLCAIHLVMKIYMQSKPMAMAAQKNPFVSILFQQAFMHKPNSLWLLQYCMTREFYIAVAIHELNNGIYLLNPFCLCMGSMGRFMEPVLLIDGSSTDTR